MRDHMLNWHQTFPPLGPAIRPLEPLPPMPLPRGVVAPVPSPFWRIGDFHGYIQTQPGFIKVSA